MAELHGIRFLLFISLMIYSAQALEMVLSNANGNFRYQVEAIAGYDNGMIFQAKPETIKVIVYVINLTKFPKSMHTKFYKQRMEISQKLSESNHELLYLGVKDFKRQNDENLVGKFISETIKGHSNQINFSINTVGEYTLNVTFDLIDKYKENRAVCEGNVERYLCSMNP